MVPSRVARGRHLSGLGLWALLSCSASPALFPTAEGSTDSVRRKPPGLALDRVTGLPPPRKSATADATLVVLEAPPDIAGARGVVSTFFRAVTSESLDDLSVLFDPRGRLWSGNASRRESLQAAWARRLNQLDYTVLDGELVYRESELELYRADEAAALQEARRLPLSPRNNEILIRVPVIAEAKSGSRLFGDEIVFLLRPKERGYKIGEIYEDFRLP